MTEKFEASAMLTWPLFINSRLLVAGNGFLAGVTVKSRGYLAVEDDGCGPEYHLYGVSPGGLCAAGKTPEEASADFYNRLTAVAFDIAEESSDFAAFQAALTSFVEQTDRHYEARWQEALEMVRANKIDMAGTPRENGDTAASIDIAEIETPAPADNPALTTFAQAA